MVRGDGAAAVRRRHRSVPAARVRQPAPALAHAVRGAARAGGDCRAVRVPRPGRHVGARRVRRAGEHGDHRLLHPIPLHVRGDDRAAARAGAALAAAPAAHAGQRSAPPPAPRTLRVDYYHTGNATEERFSLDRVVVEPLAWPGNPARPIDDANRGKYFFEVADAANGRVTYS